MNKNKNIGRLVYGTALFTLVLLITAVFASSVLYNQTVSLLTDNLRERLLTISITAAANINAADLDELSSEKDHLKPEWSRVVNTLHKAKYSNEDVVFMYIFRKTKDDPGLMEFVADADSIDPYVNQGDDPSRFVDVNRDGLIEPDGPDYLQWPGQLYPEAVDIPETFAAYNGPLTSADLYTDDYGTVLTGYAPIFDTNGNVAAILATDIKADDFFTVTRQTLNPFLVFISFLIFIILFLAITLILVWRRQAKTLTTTNVLLERANEGQSKLLHFITHQVKGYFTKSKYIFHELQTGSYGKFSSSAQEMIDQGYQFATEGVDLVQNVLNAANIEKGTVKYSQENVDLKEVLQDAVIHKTKQVQEKGLDLKLEIKDGDYVVQTDPVQIKEVFKNLIDNSIRYTRKGSILISLSSHDDMLLFKIEDSGVGILEADLPHLFKKGGKGTDSNKINPESTGYGLYIVKQVVEGSLGGKVWVESRGLNEGSTFFVEVPKKS